MTKENSHPTTRRIYQQIREVLIQARSRALQAVNTEMVACYWEIGRLIIEEEQQGEKRAEYGKRLIRDLSKRLTEEFGKGFDRTNLQHMRAFYLGFSNCDALRRELSWTHYRLLLRIEKPVARAFYEAEAVNSRW
jgi:predicted nuclease of restriction endonuclease-like (RecB) superfamily